MRQKKQPRVITTHIKIDTKSSSTKSAQQWISTRKQDIFPIQCMGSNLVVAEDGEELDARREHGVPAALADPLRHLVLRSDPRFCL